MRVKIYRYVGSYGDGIDYVKLNEPDAHINDDDWEFKGIYDLPDDFIEDCLPAYFME